jgi:hypothetical protein
MAEVQGQQGMGCPVCRVDLLMATRDGVEIGFGDSRRSRLRCVRSPLCLTMIWARRSLIAAVGDWSAATVMCDLPCKRVLRRKPPAERTVLRAGLGSSKNWSS